MNKGTIKQAEWKEGKKGVHRYLSCHIFFFSTCTYLGIHTCVQLQSKYAHLQAVDVFKE